MKPKDIGGKIHRTMPLTPSDRKILEEIYRAGRTFKTQLSPRYPARSLVPSSHTVKGKEPELCWTRFCALCDRVLISAVGPVPFGATCGRHNA